MVDGAPRGEPKAVDVSLSVLWSSSGRSDRAYAHRSRRRYPPPPARPHRVRARRARSWRAGPARWVAAHSAAPAVDVETTAAPLL